MSNQQRQGEALMWAYLWVLCRHHSLGLSHRAGLNNKSLSNSCYRRSASIQSTYPLIFHPVIRLIHVTKTKENYWVWQKHFVYFSSSTKQKTFLSTCQCWFVTHCNTERAFFSLFFWTRTTEHEVCDLLNPQARPRGTPAGCKLTYFIPGSECSVRDSV